MSRIHDSARSGEHPGQGPIDKSQLRMEVGDVNTLAAKKIGHANWVEVIDSRLAWQRQHANTGLLKVLRQVTAHVIAAHRAAKPGAVEALDHAVKHHLEPAHFKPVNHVHHMVGESHAFSPTCTG